MIGIIDYGSGNVKAISNIYNYLNIENKIILEKKDFSKVTKLILPGVGAFDSVMRKINSSGFKNIMNDYIIDRKIKILGICVGMQILASSSEEGNENGLGWIPGVVKKFKNNKIRLPHMGWNKLIMEKNSLLIKNIDMGSRFYFLHSFYFKTALLENVVCKTLYDQEFSSIINKDNIFGVQFHPEKSHDNGIKILKNFALL
jgi:glutamine amidotransferase